MGTAFSPDALRGILIPDPRISPSKTGTGSTYTQAEPQPGVPAPSSATSLVLESSGTQADTTILVQTVRAGGAVTTDAIRAGAFAWQETGGQWQGWDGPLGYAGFEPVHVWGSGGATPLYTYPHAIYTRKGTRLVSAQSTVGLGVVQSCVVHRSSSPTACCFSSPTTTFRAWGFRYAFTRATTTGERGPFRAARPSRRTSTRRRRPCAVSVRRTKADRC